MTYLEEILNKIGPSGLSELDLIYHGWTFERVFVTKHKEEIPVYRKKRWLAYVHTDGKVKIVGGLPELALSLRAEVLPKGVEEVHPEFIGGELE